MDTQNTSFVNPTSDEKSVNLIDIFMYLLFHWKWFLISLIVFGGYFGYKYNKTPFLYNRSMVVMIKTPANTQSTARLNRSNIFAMPVNVANELLQFRSKELMRKSIDNLNTDISYIHRNRFRPIELYKRSPIRVSFLSAQPDDHYSLSVTLHKNQKVELSGFLGSEDERKITANLNDTINTPVGPLIVSQSLYYAPAWFGEAIRVTKYSREQMVNVFLSRFATEQLKEDAAIIRMSMTDNSPFRAADMLNMIVEVYNEEAVADKKRIALNTEKFIDERLKNIEQELGNVEQEMQSLRQNNVGLDMTTTVETYLSDSREYRDALKELDLQLSLVKLVKQRLRDNASDLIPSNFGLVDGNIESQIGEYNNLVLKRNRLMEDGNERNPVVQDLNNSIGMMKQNITRSVDNVISSLNIKSQEFARRENQVLSKIFTMPEQQRNMLSIERNQKIKEELFLFLLNKREENSLNQAMVDDNARIIDSVSGSNAPMYPSKYRNLLLGLCLGIAVPAVVLLLILVLDTRVRTKKEIENAVTIPFLGEIPMGMDTSQHIYISGQGFDMMTEAFRMLRTNLQYMIRSKDPKVISTISFLPGAGKTFVLTNLGVSLLQINRKVILIDLDLRKGTLSSHFGHKYGQGVTNYLSDESVTLDDIIRKDAVCKNMDLIGVGPIAPNPTELLLGNRLDELIAELKKKYDFIMVDSAPIGLVADAPLELKISSADTELQLPSITCTK